MSFQGNLIILGGANGTPLPYKFIAVESYKCSPDQRLETSAKRVSTGLLHRVTCEHMPTKVEWTTHAMYNRDMEALTALFDANWTIQKERKIKVAYYNTWTGNMEVGDFYMPDPEMTILQVDTVHNRILYAPMRIALIEY